MVKRLTLFLVLVLFSSCTRHPYKKTFVISGTYLTVTSPDKRAFGIVYDEFKRLNTGLPAGILMLVRGEITVFGRMLSRARRK